MLKITKGLKLTVEDGIMPYIDEHNNEYVRVRVDGEDFCIAAHDYTKDVKAKTGLFKGMFRDKFTWNKTMMSLGDEGLTTFSKEQIQLCAAYQDDINKKFKEIDGRPLANDYYWTITKYDDDNIWIYNGHSMDLTNSVKTILHMVRPILNL